MRMRNFQTLPPQNDSVSEWLRYMVQSCEAEAGELKFLVGLWAAANYTGVLTEAQMKMLQPYIDEAAMFLDTHVRPLMCPDDMTNVVPLDPSLRAMMRREQQPAPSATSPANTTTDPQGAA